jgi:multidrug efflux pump subunit AcrA (membrane-fusion protein)
MIKNKKTYLWFMPIFLTILLLAGCTGQSSATQEVTTEIGNVTEVTLTTTIDTTGSITPRQISSVTWDTSGTISTVNVQVGQKVQAGDVLMSLDPNTVPDSLVLSQLRLAEMTSPTSIAAAQQAVLTAQNTLQDAQVNRNNLDYYDQAAIDDAYADYILAKQKYDRAYENYEQYANLGEDNPNRASAYQSMYSARVVMDSAISTYNAYKAKSSQQTYDEANTAVVLAQNQLLEAQNYLIALTGGEIPADATGSSLMTYKETKMAVDAMNLRAPFDGTVSTLYDQEGIVVSSNDASVKLVDRSKLYVTIQLDEHEVVTVSPGDTATIVIEALPDLNITGHITTIEPIGEIIDGVVYYDVQVELDQPNDQIPLNATASVIIQIGEPQVSLAVPATAIQNDADGNEYIQVISNGSTQNVSVVSGQILADDTVVITGDLQVGDQVILLLQASNSTTGLGSGGGGFIMGR